MSKLYPENSGNGREITLPPLGRGSITKGQRGKGGNRKEQTLGVV